MNPSPANPDPSSRFTQDEADFENALIAAGITDEEFIQLVDNDRNITLMLREKCNQTPQGRYLIQLAETAAKQRGLLTAAFAAVPQGLLERSLAAANDAVHQLNSRAAQEDNHPDVMLLHAPTASASGSNISNQYSAWRWGRSAYIAAGVFACAAMVFVLLPKTGDQNKHNITHESIASIGLSAAQSTELPGLDALGTSQVDQSHSLAQRIVLEDSAAEQLAREGRLLVRVVSVAPSSAAELLNSGDARWRVEGEVRKDMVEAIRPYMVSHSGVTPVAEVGPDSGRFLTAEMFGPPLDQSLPRQSIAYNTDSSAYVVQLHPGAIEGLRDTLRSRLRAGVLLEQLPAGTVVGGQKLEVGNVEVPVIIENH